MKERTLAPSAERLESGHPARLWYAVGGAPAAWVLQSSIAWFITGRACADGSASGTTRVLLLGVGLAALAAGGYAVLIALNAWRADTHSEDVLHAEGRGLIEYVAAAGFLVSSVFVLAIVWTALPAVMVDVCQGIR